MQSTAEPPDRVLEICVKQWVAQKYPAFNDITGLLAAVRWLYRRRDGGQVLGETPQLRREAYEKHKKRVGAKASEALHFFQRWTKARQDGALVFGGLPACLEEVPGDRVGSQMRPIRIKFTSTNNFPRTSGPVPLARRMHQLGLSDVSPREFLYWEKAPYHELIDLPEKESDWNDVQAIEALYRGPAANKEIECARERWWEERMDSVENASSFQTAQAPLQQENIAEDVQSGNSSKQRASTPADDDTEAPKETIQPMLKTPVPHSSDQPTREDAKSQTSIAPDQPHIAGNKTPHEISKQKKKSKHKPRNREYHKVRGEDRVEENSGGVVRNEHWVVAERISRDDDLRSIFSE